MRPINARLWPTILTVVNLQENQLATVWTSPSDTQVPEETQRRGQTWANYWPRTMNQITRPVFPSSLSHWNSLFLSGLFLLIILWGQLSPPSLDSRHSSRFSLNVSYRQVRGLAVSGITRSFLGNCKGKINCPSNRLCTVRRFVWEPAITQPSGPRRPSPLLGFVVLTVGIFCRGSYHLHWFRKRWREMKSPLWHLTRRTKIDRYIDR